MAQQNIYDNDDFFEDYRAKREEEINFNDCIETPILLGMMPDLTGRAVLDIGCGMGHHAGQYAQMGAATVLGIDLSEKMLAYAREHHSGPGITYRRMALEDLGALEERFDVVTSSLVFDYARDLDALFGDIYRVLREDGVLVFSISHPLATAWDGTCDRYTRTETGERLYANLSNYMVEGLRKVKWVVEGYEVYHRTFATLVNALLRAGFALEECQESNVSDELRRQYPAKFGGTLHRPDFVFFRARKGRGTA